MKSYVVLGGGISGLSAAWKLSRNNRANVTLIERSDRVGGWMRSERTEHGSVFELGPRSLRTAGTQGKQTLNLVSSRVMYSTHSRIHLHGLMRYAGIEAPG